MPCNEMQSPDQLLAVQRRVLRALARCAEPVGAEPLRILINADPPEMSPTSLQLTLSVLHATDWIRMSVSGKFELTERGWQILSDERKAMPRFDFESSSANLKAIAESLDAERVTICEAKEPPSHATVCVDEDELDEWWDQLGVDLKAEAFVRFSLYGVSHGDFSDHEARVPIEGAVGEEAKAAQ